MINKFESLLPEVKRIVRDKATEYPNTGSYNEMATEGTYLCRQCGLALFRSSTKFHSGCGWPSFDEEIQGAVQKHSDADGIRTEITCSRCDAHLGHVFHGENFTDKNTRHCVNSASLDFVADKNVKDTNEAIVAGGCFWGIEYLFQQLPGVLKTEVGYCGGHEDSPTYQTVCNGSTGHLEAVRIVFDTAKTHYQEVIKYFFEIHDPTQGNGQGPDIGTQYKSAIFYYDEKQKNMAEELIQKLTAKKYHVVTQLKPIAIFWPAEEYHQRYYQKQNTQPYCHRYEKRF